LDTRQKMGTITSTADADGSVKAYILACPLLMMRRGNKGMSHDASAAAAGSTDPGSPPAAELAQPAFISCSMSLGKQEQHRCSKSRYSKSKKVKEGWEVLGLVPLLNPQHSRTPGACSSSVTTQS
jgi:hypothetical protein